MTKESKKKIQKKKVSKNLNPKVENTNAGVSSINKGVAAFLVFIVFSSKGILIYNEEILVGLGFLGFVYYVSKFHGKDIGTSLDSRGEGLKAKVGESLKKNKEDEESFLGNWNGGKVLSPAGWAPMNNGQSKAFMTWLSAGLLGSHEGFLKTSIGFGAWGLGKDGSNQGGDDTQVWWNGFRGRVYEAIADSPKPEKGKASIQQEWIASSLSTLEKVNL